MVIDAFGVIFKSLSDALDEAEGPGVKEAALETLEMYRQFFIEYKGEETSETIDA